MLDRRAIAKREAAARAAVRASGGVDVTTQRAGGKAGLKRFPGPHDADGPVIPRFYNKPRPPSPPSLGDLLFARGHLGFAGQMQGAMGQMAGLNLANQQASLQNKALLASVLPAWWQTQADLFRTAALARLLGKGGGENSPRYTSNIGQGINFYPYYNDLPVKRRG